MKAIVQDAYGGPELLELSDIDEPEVGDDDVLIRVCAAGVDPGVLHLMTGLPYLVRIAGYGLRAPRARVPGSDVAGLVESVGRDVTQLQPGDAVYGTCEGSFAGFARAKSHTLAPMPTHLSFEQAAAVPTSATTALQALRDQGAVQGGQRVLIIGAAGGVGTFTVQLAKTYGATVTGVCSGEKTELVRSIGADHVIDYTLDNFTEVGWRFDLIVDTAGNRRLKDLRRVLTPKGTLVIVGGEGAGRWIGGVDRQLRALAWSPFIRQTLRTFIAKQRSADLQYLTGLLEAGSIAPVIDRTFSLTEAPDALRYLQDGHARGKVVITV